MRLAVFGALGRVGSCLVRLAQGNDIWQIDVNYSSNPLDKVDVVVDFSLPEATKRVVEFCKRYNCPLVSGVTGQNQEQLDLLDQLANQVTVVKRDNFCRGIQLLEEICQLIASKTNWRCEIVETHRFGKKDSPSGTAKRLAGKIVKCRKSFSAVTIHSLRLGSNFGRHQVVFATNGQSLTLTHQAENVEIFAQGALEVAKNLVEGNKNY